GKVASELAGRAAETAASEEERGVDRAAADDDGVGEDGASVRVHGGCPAAARGDLLDRCARDDRRTGRSRPGDVRDPGVLLGGGRAPERAYAGADASLRIPAQIPVRPSEPLGPEAR